MILELHSACCGLQMDKLKVARLGEATKGIELIESNGVVLPFEQKVLFTQRKLALLHAEKGQVATWVERLWP